ncbi:hypothetical protein COLO4_35087 [Corchorus olitorius]|uniref:Uncharacterized protein n=1 Tax=Corchorus olitorius TaxID=93759 RepID=A0A1R3GI61_9ROSI|nr:hypothetical protein COLO4_35087 [Corchorus olitorius]
MESDSYFFTGTQTIFKDKKLRWKRRAYLYLNRVIILVPLLLKAFDRNWNEFKYQALLSVFFSFPPFSPGEPLSPILIYSKLINAKDDDNCLNGWTDCHKGLP